jgi:hypothetical protein
MKRMVCYMKWPIVSLLSFLLLMSLSSSGREKDPAVSIVTDKSPGAPVSHGLAKLTDVLRAKNISFERIEAVEKARGKWIIVAGLASGGGAASQMLKAASRSIPEVSEALAIWKTERQNKPVWVINGFDNRGLMYGLLDVANRVSWSTDEMSPLSEVKEIVEQPDVSERAVSIYTMNRAYWESRFYDKAYWARYLDMLAKNRFNSLVVIFGYENGGFLAPPYPYFFDVENFKSVRMVGITPEQQQRNLEALKNLIMMAHERGIKFTVGIWDHIYRGGVQGGGIPGTRNAPDQPQEGLVWGVNADNLISYNKTALAKFVKLIPDLDGIQFRMHNESGLKHGEQLAFWSDVFKMMKQAAPHLRLDLRAKELPESVINSAIDVGINFRIATKYWMEQMGMPYHPTKTNPEKSPIRHSYAYLLRYPKQYKLHWRLWNGGTSRILLWGDPEYARRFAESTHLYDGDGFEVNEPLATKMEAQPHDAKPFDLLSAEHRYYDWEFERYWHFFQVFGRIGYNPDTSPDVWKKEFEQRFGKKAGPLIEKALHRASWVLPRIITSSYPYRLFPTTRGWAEKQRLGDLPDFAKAELSDMQQFASFDEEAKIRIEGGETPKILPSVNSLWFKQTSSDINKLILQAEQAMGYKQNKEFNSTITDLKILSALARYHSRRIPAAVNYRIFERTGDVSALEEAIANERNAIEAWREIVASAADVYTDNLMLGVCVADLCGHWKDELIALEKGLATLEQKRETLKAGADTSTTPVKTVSHHQPSAIQDHHKLFEFEHVPIISIPVSKPLAVNVQVNTPAGVKWVRLRYRSVNQDLPYQTLQMVPTGDKDSYRATVPADQIDPEYDLMYFIEAMDNNGRGTIYPDLNSETPYRFVKLIR